MTGRYRSREEVEGAQTARPSHTLFDPAGAGGIGNQQVEGMEARARGMVDDAVQFAAQAPYPNVEEGTYPVYAEEVRHD